MSTVKSAIRLCLATGLLLGAQAQAANWLMLQGTESDSAAPRAKVWGFVQAQYQEDFGDANAAGQYVPPKLIGPDLDSQSAFNVNRARIGVRGANLPLDSKTNYFLLLEMGNNAITNGAGSFAHMTDASVTLNHLKGARVRMGLFKYPGSEEGLQAIHVFDYVNFTEVTNQLMLERFQNSKTGSNVAPQTLPPTTSLNTYDRPVGAFRDVGVQVFDTFKRDDWEHSYAVMVGNGNGLNLSDDNNAKDTYLYWSSEKVYGGKGGRREGWKFFGWYMDGTRSFDGDQDGTVEDYDRKRWGVGTKYLRKPWRVTAEYLKGEGMIFNGPDKSSYGLVPASVGNPTHAASGLNAKANGWYLDGGYYIPNSKWEVDARYDVYNRLTDGNFELEFTKLTLGAQYHFNKKTRVALNYEIRNAEAVNFASGAGPNGNLDGVGNRVAIQVTAIY